MITAVATDGREFPVESTVTAFSAGTALIGLVSLRDISDRLAAQAEAEQLRVAGQVRALRPGVPVLYMSGYAQPVLATQGALDPYINLLEKPFSEATLLRRVRRALDSHTGPGNLGPQLSWVSPAARRPARAPPAPPTGSRPGRRRT